MADPVDPQQGALPLDAASAQAALLEPPVQVARRDSTPELRHKRFAQEFFIDMDPERAYEAAGYNGKSVSVRQAGICNLFRNSSVRDLMRNEFEVLRRKVDLDQQTHAIEVCRLAYSDMRAVASWGPDGVSVIPSQELSEDAARTVQRVTAHTKTYKKGRGAAAHNVTEVEVDVILHSKNAALDLLARMYERGQALRTELENTLRQLAALAVRYIPEERLPQYLAEARLVLGDIVAQGEAIKQEP